MALLADPHRTALSLFTILGACPVPFDTEATPSPHPNAGSSQEASCLMGSCPSTRPFLVCRQKGSSGAMEKGLGRGRDGNIGQGLHASVQIQSGSLDMSPSATADQLIQRGSSLVSAGSATAPETVWVVGHSIQLQALDDGMPE